MVFFTKPMMRVELMTSSLPMKCSTTELHGQIKFDDYAIANLDLFKWAELDLNQRSFRNGFTVRLH